jgi:hypothetical protein
LVLQLDRPRLWSAIGLNKADAVYFSDMHCSMGLNVS